jgi:hypothetical protein
MLALGWLRVSLIIAVLALLAPAAHVLEMANKLALDGPLWLAVQQHLYRGWGPIIGAPTEIGGLLVNLALALRGRRHGAARRACALAACAYAGMIAAFFRFNAPVNAAVNGWTAATLPSDWPAYRWRWEIGHAIAALLGAIALAAVIRASLAEARRAAAPRNPSPPQ